MKPGKDGSQMITGKAATSASSTLTYIQFYQKQ